MVAAVRGLWSLGGSDIFIKGWPDLIVIITKMMNKLILAAASATLINAWEMPDPDHPFHPLKLMQEHGRLQ